VRFLRLLGATTHAGSTSSDGLCRKEGSSGGKDRRPFIKPETGIKIQRKVQAFMEFGLRARLQQAGYKPDELSGNIFCLSRPVAKVFCGIQVHLIIEDPDMIDTLRLDPEDHAMEEVFPPPGKVGKSIIVKMVSVQADKINPPVTGWPQNGLFLIQ
jgi:hypothetical protein